MGLLLLCCIMLPASHLQAQNQNEEEDIWKILSPAANSDVNNGEVFLAVQYKNGIKLQANSVQIYLDDFLVTGNIKVNNNKITMLYLLPLKSGRHTFEIRAKAENKKKKIRWLPNISWTFRTKDPKAATFYSIPDTLKSLSPKAARYQLNGTLIAQYKAQQVTGTGKDLLQQTPYQRDISLNMVGRIGQVNFPVKIYNTSDEITYARGLQSRNYYQVGAQTQWGELFYGDMNPTFDRFTLTGTRVFGARLMLKKKRSELNIVDGILQRAGEGVLLHYIPGNGFPPPTLRDDSTYYIPGIYKQHISALRISYGNKMEGSLLGINLVKVKDVENSIKYGQNPQDNLVASIDETFATNQNKMRFNAGVAFSLYTANTSHGALNKDWVDSAYDVALPFNPQKIRSVFTINSTTIQPGKQSLASYIGATFRSKHQTIGVDCRYIGTGFKALANPFLQNDVQGFGINDQIALWKRKINMNIRYNYLANNLINSHFATINNHLANANLLFAPSQKLPQFNLLYMTQYRISAPTKSKLTAANDLFTSFGGGMNYNFSAAKCNHGISFQYTKSIRDDKIFPGQNNQIQLFSTGINENFVPISLMLDLSYSKTYFTSSLGITQAMYETVNAALRYKSKKLRTDFSVGSYINHYFPTDFSNASMRNTFTAGISCQRLSGFIFDVEAGYSPYRDERFVFNNYDYTFATGRLTYNFDFK